jgi:type 1 fimbriae regulatory protein FimE
MTIERYATLPEEMMEAEATARRSPRLFGRIGARAKMPFAVHPHMLRHGCGYALTQYLGHKNIQHIVRYTDMAPDRFKDFWRD